MNTRSKRKLSLPSTRKKLKKNHKPTHVETTSTNTLKNKNRSEKVSLDSNELEKSIMSTGTKNAKPAARSYKHTEIKGTRKCPSSVHKSGTSPKVLNENKKLSMMDSSTSSQDGKRNPKKSENNSRNEKEGKNLWCSKCGKERARKKCTQSACFKCCDNTECIGHRTRRMMEGSLLINKQAARKRALAIRKGAFRETSFRYVGETLLLWNFREYISVPKWRDDALRRSRKNRELFTMQNQNPTFVKRKGSRKKRFRKIWEEIHKKAKLIEDATEAEGTSINTEDRPESSLDKTENKENS